MLVRLCHLAAGADAPGRSMRWRDERDHGVRRESLSIRDFHVDCQRDFTVAWERTGLFLAVDVLAVEIDFKDAGFADDEFGFDVVAVAGVEFGNQTGRLRLVVSLPAVGDSYFHVCAS